MDDTIPLFVREQQRLLADASFQAKLLELSKKKSSEKRHTLFISHAWNLEKDKDPFQEQWVDAFVDQMAVDFESMGFDVFLDKKQGGVGVHLNSTMRKKVSETDHVLLVLTNTYFYKVNEVPLGGVSIELDYILERIKNMGGVSIASEERFLIPFLLVPRIPGFPLVEGYSGFAGTHVKKVGYENALTDVANKIYATDESLKFFVDNPTEFAGYLKAAKEKCVDAEMIPNREFIFASAVTAGVGTYAERQLDEYKPDATSQMLALMGAAQPGDRVYLHSALAKGSQGKAFVRSATTSVTPAELIGNLGLQRQRSGDSSSSDEDTDKKVEGKKIEKKK